jgi:NAD+ synthase
MEGELEGMIRLAEINPAVVIDEIGDFIVKSIKEAGKSGAVIGLSGGVDSDVVAAIAKHAFDRHKGLALRGYYMPSENSSSQDEEDAMALAEALQIPYQKIPIQDILSSFEQSNPTFLEPFHLGNAAATVRIAQLSSEAGRHNSVILGTGNRDEYFLGYFTKRGDGAADLMPILTLTKGMVYQVAKHIRKSIFRKFPERTITKAPTAGLVPGQTDEGDLGMSYDEAALIINGYLQGYNQEEIRRITGLPISKVERVRQLHEASSHKRRLAPFPEVSMDYHNGQKPLSEADKALFIGRFQMLHIGHVDMFYQITEHPSIRQLLIGIGTQGNTKDPRNRYLFSYDEVKQLLTPLLEEIGLPYVIREVADINNNLEYARHVAGVFPEMDERTALVSADPSTIKCFDARLPVLRPEHRIVVHSSRIRELIRENKPYAHLVHNAEAMRNIGYEARLRDYWRRHANEPLY